MLNRRMADARQAGGPAAVGAGAAAAAAAAAADEALSASEEEQGGRPSFLQSTDEELASALSDRISQVADRMVQAGAAGGSRGSVDAADGEGGEDAEAEGLLTGPLLRELIYSKWGRQYDVSFVRRDLPLGKTLICLNVRAPGRRGAGECWAGGPGLWGAGALQRPADVHRPAGA